MSNIIVPDQPRQDEVSSYDRLIAEISGAAPEVGIQCIKQFLLIYPSFPLAHNDLGVLYHRSGNSTLALAHYEKAVRLQPENVTFRKNLADFYAVELGWYEDAVDIYLEVLKRNPRDTEALIALGQIGSAMEGKQDLQPATIAPALPAAAAEAFQPKAIAPPVIPATPPQDTRTSRERHEAAATRAAGGDIAGAINDLKELLLKDPTFAQAHNDLAVLCQQAGDPEAALAGHRRAVELQPENAIYRKNLADFLFVCKGDYQGALEQYNSLLAKQPRDVEVLRAIAHICLEMDNMADAEYFLDRALSAEPWNKEIREALTKLKQPVPSPPAATVPASNPAPAAAPAAKPIEQLYRDALELAKADQLHDARILLETVLQLEPDNALAHNDLGVISYRLGDVAGAELHYQKATELEPTTINFRKNLADLYFTELGRSDDAINIYLDLHKKHPRDVEVLMNLGHICTAVGHGTEAKSFYRRALEIEPWNKDARSALQAPVG